MRIPPRPIEYHGGIERRPARSPRELIGGSLLLVLALMLALALATFVPGAQALPLRGHVFQGAFGEPGSGDEQLSEPTAVAVNEATGDVYVLDRANHRVERFDRQGHFISVWGWGVGAGKKYEVCTSGCHAGIAGNHKYQLGPTEPENPGEPKIQATMTLAVDNSTDPADPSKGYVYLATEGRLEGEEGKEQIDKFTAAGEPVEEISEVKYLLSEPVSEEKKKRHEEELSLELTEELEATEVGGKVGERPALHGLAVGLDGTVWIYYEEELFRLPNTKLKAVGRPVLETTEGENGVREPGSGLAIDARGDVYLAEELPDPPRPGLNLVTQQKVNKAEGRERLQVVREELDSQSTTALTIDQSAGHAASGAIYLDHGGAIDAYDGEDTLLEEFGEESHLQSSDGIALDAATRYVYATDAAGGQVEVFEPQQAGVPTVDAVTIPDVADEAAQLDATIDPRGAPTTWQLLYGTPHTSCKAEPAACTTLPQETLATGPDEGFGAVGVGIALDAAHGHALKPATTYHYLLIAKNGHSPTEPVDGETREGTFRTLPSSGGTIDERVWELVSPPVKHGAGVEAPTKVGGLIQAAVGGGALTYFTNGPVEEPEGSRSFEVTQDLSARGEAGWSTSDIVTPNVHGNGIFAGRAPEYQAFSSDLALALVQPYPFSGQGPLAEPPLNPPLSPSEAGHQQKTIYLRADAPLQPGAAEEAANYAQAQANGAAMHNPGFLALVTEGDTIPGAKFGEETPEAAPALAFLSATPDLAHVVIGSGVPLTAAEGSHVPAPTPGKTNLYEWSENALHLVSVIEESGASAADSPSLGDLRGVDMRNAISADGSRVFFTGKSTVEGEHPAHLYMRDTAANRTVQLDVRQEGAPELEPATESELPEFQDAGADGSRVLFTDQARLVNGAGGEDGKPDLYMCEIRDSGGVPECALTDLTLEHAGESASVQGEVIGMSGDGGYVYFVADGALAPGAAPGHCAAIPEPHATCNLYVDHYDGEAHEWRMALAASVANEDRADWRGTGGAATAEDLGEITSRVSPDGRYVTFMSQRSLTGYDNEDVTSQHPGERMDEEVFLYHAAAADGETGALVCASCDPSGARPHGVFDPVVDEEETSEGLGLLVDTPASWEGHWLSASVPSSTKIDYLHAVYQPNYLSDSGRLLFNSAGDLVAQDKNGKEDVYEYEPEGVPTGRHECTTATDTFSAAARGCIGLISSGTSDRESALLDASVAGGEGPHGEELQQGAGDVYFMTAERLTDQDQDNSFDVYDAHECTAASTCLYPPTIEPPNPCKASETCRPFVSPAPAAGPEIASAGSPSGNQSPPAAAKPSGQVLPAKAKSKPKPKGLSRAEKLAKALSSCRARYKHSRHRRKACEKQARLRYAPAHRATRAAAERATARAGGRRKP
jgi:NHL repeat